MIILKTEDEIEQIRISCLLVSDTLAYIATLLRPGISPKELDNEAYEYIKDHKASPSFLNYRGFPASLCISKNEVVVHGIPDDKALQDNDLVSVDCGVYFQGFHGDSAYTFCLGEPEEAIIKLCKITKESLYKGIDEAKVGNRIGDIGYAVQFHTEKSNGYGVVRDLVGHGIGKNLHEAPDVPNFGKRGKGPQLKHGMTIAIEPMINLGTSKVRQLNDGWTIVTADKKASAHYEHTIAVYEDGPKILSNHSKIEENIKNNSNLYSL